MHSDLPQSGLALALTLLHTKCIVTVSLARYLTFDQFRFMKSMKNLSKLQSFLGEAAAVRRHASRHNSVEVLETGDEINKIANFDYAGPLRKCFSRDQLDELILDARKTIWPHLNLEPLRLGSITEYSETFSKLG